MGFRQTVVLSPGVLPLFPDALLRSWRSKIFRYRVRNSPVSVVSLGSPMSRIRLISVIALVLIAIGGMAAAILFSSSFQTWAVRRSLAARPELRASVARVDAGLRDVKLENLRYEWAGAVLTVPRVDAQMEVFDAAFSNEVTVSRMVARGWTLDLSKAPEPVAAGSGSPGGQAGPIVLKSSTRAADSNHATIAAKTFAGIFDQLRLPVDCSLNGVELEGVVVLPKGRGHVKVTLRGGGLAAGKEGKFDLVAEATLADPKVAAVRADAALSATMDTPRSFTQLAVRLDAAARGTSFPDGVKLNAGLTAARAAAGETYSVALVTTDRQLASLKADLPRDASRLDGTWKLDMRDADLAPFSLGHPLPAFTAAGEGRFDTDAQFASVHATGKLATTASRLEVLHPHLAGVGAVKLGGQFDLTRRGSTLAVQQLELTVAAAQPVATVTALQSFEYDAMRDELRAADATRELVGIALQGLPLDWLRPLLGDITATGGDIRGELVALARAKGFGVRARSPLEVDRLSVTRAGRPLVSDLAVSLSAVADYTAAGWQADIGRLALRSAGERALEFEGKVGQLTGPRQPLKATGKLTGKLAPVLRQPFAAGALALTDGEVAVDFVGSFGETMELQAKLALASLSAPVHGKPLALPSVSADIRADLKAGGEIVLHLPLLLEHDSRKSDLTLAGSIGPKKDKIRTVDAQLTSTQLTLDDAKLLAAALPQSSAIPKAKSDKAAPPPWAGLNGSIALQIKKLISSGNFEMSDVGGRVKIDAGALKIETAHVGFGEAGRAALNGLVTYDASAVQPYALEADLTVRDLDATELLRVVDPVQQAFVEGRFDVSGKLTRRAGALAGLSAPSAEFAITSKGGVFRGLPVNAARLAENSGKIASWLASASSALGLSNRYKDGNDISNKTQAVSEVAKVLNNIAYDQLSMTVSHDAAQNLAVRDFALISPELRITGLGATEPASGVALWDQTLLMQYELRARGRAAELLKYLGALDAQADDLGYSSCTLPLTVRGSLSQFDTSELNAKLASLAVEKGGVGDRASEFFNRLMGK